MMDLATRMEEKAVELSSELERRVVRSLVEAIRQVDFPSPELLRGWARFVQQYLHVELRSFANELEEWAKETEAQREHDLAVLELSTHRTREGW